MEGGEEAVEEGLEVRVAEPGEAGAGTSFR